MRYGFTLLELVVVITSVALLMTLSISCTVGHSAARARFTDGNANTRIEATSRLSQELKPSELATTADTNPRGRVGRQNLGNDHRGRNSINHDQEGQNVGFSLVGHVEWFTTTRIPDTQPLDNDSALDDIYQSCGSKDDDANGRRGAINDAFLIP